MRVRAALVDRPGSVAAKARQRRWAMLLDRFPRLGEMDVVDLGGTVDYWLSAPVRPRTLCVVNLRGSELGEPPSWARTVEADACTWSPSGRYDLVVSNSLIEHLTGWERRRMLSDQIHRLADHHWVQTPYRYFPVEPHWICPFLQHAPVAVRAWVSRWWPLMHSRAQDWHTSVYNALEVDLLSKTEMRWLFPDSQLLVEGWMGLPKALIATR